MLSVHRLLLNRRDRFFDLLDANAHEATLCAAGLEELLATPPDARLLKEFIASRRRNQFHARTMELLCASLITPMDREDIDSVSSRLNRIPKPAVKFVERLLLAQAHVRPELFRDQVDLLVQATQVVSEMVAQLRGPISLNKVKLDNERLQNCERAADELMVQLLRELYNGNYTPLQVLAMKELFELLERAIDRCRDVGNLILQIALRSE